MFNYSHLIYIIVFLEILTKNTSSKNKRGIKSINFYTKVNLSYTKVTLQSSPDFQALI